MLKKKSILVENQEMRHLLSIIKSHYLSDEAMTLKEVSMTHVANRIVDETVRDYVVNCWYNLQTKVGHEVRLLENNCKKSIINRLYRKSKDLNFIIKTRADNSSDELHQSIKKASNIDVIIKEFWL